MFAPSIHLQILPQRKLVQEATKISLAEDTHLQNAPFFFKSRGSEETRGNGLQTELERELGVVNKNTLMFR